MKTLEKQSIRICLETGSKRAFALAPDWPGWCRGAAGEPAALQALVDYGQRYAAALSLEGLAFQPPAAASDLVVTDRLTGSDSADWGIPNAFFAFDSDPISSTDLEHFQTLLTACWKAFDLAVRSAEGYELRKGPRGGGRDLQKIIAHVREVDDVYITQLGGQPDPGLDIWPARVFALDSLAAATHGAFPAKGPRGGKRWPPRYFVRRLAWHLLDHAWEIEDRIIR